MNILLSSKSNRVTFPPIPTREQVCGVNIQFQGQVIVIDGVRFPWFEPALQCLTRAQRLQVYRQKKAHGDTHCIIEFLPDEIIYDEPGQPYQDFTSPNFEKDPELFRNLVEEIILNKFIPGIVYNGDNGDNLFDGYPNALRQLPILYNLLKASKYKDLNQYCLMLRFWDGVFYGSSPENVQAFGTAFREISPNGYLGIEHNPGHIPVGEGGSDYLPNGRMDAYDVVFSEYADYIVNSKGQQISNDNPDLGNDTVWQINGRLEYNYIHPLDQPPNDDPNPPFYLVSSPRGKRYHCAFEHGFAFGAYPWVRVNINNYWDLQQKIQARRQYMRAMGCRYVG